MMYRRLVLLVVSATLLMLTASGEVVAQATNGPMTIEGANHRSVHSAATLGAGGVSVIARDNSAVMLVNPSTLASISGLQITIGGLYRSIDQSQAQQYAPVRYYPNLSLLLEGLANDLPDPDPNLIGFTPADSVQRAIDGLGPDWDRSHSSSAPLQFFAAIPIDFGETRLVAGVGVVEYGDFGFYAQNNNALTPNVLSQRPVPISRPTDNNPLDVDWYQTVHSREGVMTGYGGALAFEWKRFGAVFGLSGTYVTGRTTDFEHEIGRGRLTFFANEFRVDTLLTRITRSGWSDFSAFDFGFSTALSTETVTAALVIRPPMTLRRTFASDILMDTVGTGQLSYVSGEDRMSIPWRGSAALAVQPRQNLTFGIEYELRPYSSATLTPAQGAEREPWMSSASLRLGAEYRPANWLALRGGMHRDAETFGADGRAIQDEPVWHVGYTLGAGFAYAGAQLNLAYETRDVSYQDVMASAVYHNRQNRHSVVVDLIYTFNWGL